MPGSSHLIITDSGLGGLSICAEIERNLRLAGPFRTTRLTYVNAWPEEGGGYNAIPEPAERARVFDRALSAMDRLGADRILIACNTLSIVYPETRHSRAPATPVQGIVDAGVDLFHEALIQDPASALIVLGTRSTVESGAHRDGLVARGVDPRRIASIDCHGLAAAIEADPRGMAAALLIEQYASAARLLHLPGSTIFAGLACTHFGYVGGAFASAIEKYTGRPVRALNPNYDFVQLVAPDPENGPDPHVARMVTVEVVSKVELRSESRQGIGRLIEPVSPATARALQSYSHVPELF